MQEQFELERYTACDCAQHANQTCDKCAIRGYVESLRASLTRVEEALTRIAALSSHEFSPPDMEEDLTRWETTHQRIARIAKEALGQGPWPNDLSRAIPTETERSE